MSSFQQVRKMMMTTINSPQIDPRLVSALGYRLTANHQYKRVLCPEDILNSLETDTGDIAKLLGVAVSSVYNWRKNRDSISFNTYRDLHQLFYCEKLVEQAMVRLVLPIIQEQFIADNGPPPEEPKFKGDEGEYELEHGYWEMHHSEYLEWVWGAVESYFESRGMPLPNSMLAHQFDTLRHLPIDNQGADQFVRMWMGGKTLDELDKEMDEAMLGELGPDASEEAKQKWNDDYFNMKRTEQAT